MEQSDPDCLSEDDNASLRSSEVGSDDNSVDIISTDCGDEDFGNRTHSEAVNKNKFSIENILGLSRKDVPCDGSRTDRNNEGANSNDNVRRVKCVKPTPISAATRNTG